MGYSRGEITETREIRETRETTDTRGTTETTETREIKEKRHEARVKSEEIRDGRQEIRGLSS